MTKPRLAIAFPTVFVLLTVVLWFWSKAQYDSFVHTNAASAGWPEMWTDYVPVPLELAGALNVPVATFAYPTYRLLHEETSSWTLFVLLIGVALQWSYVGWSWDNQKHRPIAAWYKVVASLGVLFGAFVLLISFQMHHVALAYRTGALLWSVCICWHFVRVLTHRAISAR